MMPSSYGIRGAVVALVVLGGCATTAPIEMPRHWDDKYLENANSPDGQVKAFKSAIAVLPFHVSQKVVGSGDIGMLSIVTNAIEKTGRFALVERGELNRVLEEQDFGQSGRVDKDSAAKLGRLAGARAVLYGAVSSASQQKTDKFAYDVLRTEVRVDARLVDVDTSNIIFSETASGISEQKIVTDARGRTISGVVDSDGEYKNAAKDAINNLANKIANLFPAIGRVVSSDRGELILDIGSEMALEKGDRLVIFRLRDRIIHPVTKKPIGWHKDILGSIEITSVQQNSAKAVLKQKPDNASSIKPGDIAVLDSVSQRGI